MGRRRRQLLIVFVLVLLLGFAFYVKLWTIDYRISIEEAQLLRQQFDIANREAMDESAEWRRRYDAEAEKASKCIKELNAIKASIKGNAAGFNKKLEMLQKENLDLLERIETMKQELEEEKLKCSMQQH
ncbi:hypothetical protein M9H77_24623 [Catharanthus roseus]|uniref:Uncharacterized protein n=1 Tax=Catharanthus roseus TaxID=4058 RepID=A0ACC0AYD4_CATRO|nr:hypothetical protein M9H77_24623 [Catharanthus roseus]